MLRRIAVFLLAALIWSGVALAQSSDVPDYESWSSRAVTAEQVIDAERASDRALEELRTEIADWRTQFLEAQGVNAARIKTIELQIEALGPVPGEGEAPEPDDIAQRRAELENQLKELRAPALRAEEAHTRADGIIGEIDTIIRERQAAELLELGPSPLNPTHWPGTLEDLLTSLKNFWAEISTNAHSDILQAEAKRNLPVIITLTAVALLLLVRGHRWATGGVARLRGATRRGTGVWRFALSLGQILLPLIGLTLLTIAAFYTGMLGDRWTAVVQQLPGWAATLLGIRWLADQGFSEDESIAMVPLKDDERRKARAAANALSVLYVLNEVLNALTQVDSYGPATVAVLNFPILLLSGVILARLGTVRRDKPSAEEKEEADGKSYKMGLIHILGRAAIVLGVAGPLMAAFGYYRVGEALIYPAIATLALIGLVLVLQRFVYDFYALVTGRDAEDDNSLIPVLAGFVLALASVPILALIWGARVADLTELWAQFVEGFQIGETRFSPSDFFVVLVVFMVGYALTRLLQGGLRSTVLPKTKIDPGGQTAIVSGVGYVGIFLAALVSITVGGLDLSSLAIVAGALSVGIGFGLQNIVSNFVSGIILLIERPISQGDWIEVGGQHGIVKDISVRSTRIETFDKFDLIVPNADLVSGQVRNYTHGNVLGRVIVPVGVAYGTDTRVVEKVLLDIARRHEMVLMNPAPYIYFKGFGADSMDFEIRAILRDVGEIIKVQTEMNHQIVQRFAEEGIEIPFAQRDVWLRNPEVLRPQPEASETVAPEARAEEMRPVTGQELNEGAGEDDGSSAGDGDGDGR